MPHTWPPHTCLRPAEYFALWEQQRKNAVSMAMEEEEEAAASKRGGRRQERQPAVEPAKKAEQVCCWRGCGGYVFAPPCLLLWLVGPAAAGGMGARGGEAFCCTLCSECPGRSRTRVAPLLAARGWGCGHRGEGLPSEGRLGLRQCPALPCLHRQVIAAVLEEAKGEIMRVKAAAASAAAAAAAAAATPAVAEASLGAAPAAEEPGGQGGGRGAQGYSGVVPPLACCRLSWRSFRAASKPARRPPNAPAPRAPTHPEPAPKPAAKPPRPKKEVPRHVVELPSIPADNFELPEVIKAKKVGGGPGGFNSARFLDTGMRAEVAAGPGCGQLDLQCHSVAQIQGVGWFVLCRHVCRMLTHLCCAACPTAPIAGALRRGAEGPGARAPAAGAGGCGAAPAEEAAGAGEEAAAGAAGGWRARAPVATCLQRRAGMPAWPAAGVREVCSQCAVQ